MEEVLAIWRLAIGAQTACPRVQSNSREAFARTSCPRSCIAPPSLDRERHGRTGFLLALLLEESDDFFASQGLLSEESFGEFAGSLFMRFDEREGFAVRILENTIHLDFSIVLIGLVIELLAHAPFEDHFARDLS